MNATRRAGAGAPGRRRGCRAARGRRAGLVAAVLLATAGSAHAGAPAAAPVPFRVAPAKGGAAGETVDLPISFPGDAAVRLRSPRSSWAGLRALEFQVRWPEDAPTNTQVLVYLKDWDYFWYQCLLPRRPVPGEWTRFVVDLRPSAEGWRPVGHHGAWQLRALMGPREAGIRLFSDGRYAGLCTVGKVVGLPRTADASPPSIRNVQVNRDRLPCREKFEVTFDLPDRYPDPFDDAQVAVAAAIEEPDGTKHTIDGFFLQDYYRLTDDLGERLLPQGGGHWAVRFAPRKPGVHHFTLRVRDRYGTAEWGPGSFEAGPPSGPGYIRVSRRDPRFFERDDGSFFFPIGLNTHSMVDVRFDTQFPWKERPRLGKSHYEDLFRRMARSGENLAEVWMSAWSLGLEWSDAWEGYHGIGQYNLMHAWELDRVVDAAESRDMSLNLVIHNHGKFSDWCDEEWDSNPFNVALGGYLRRPEEYFTNERAMGDYRKLMRYVVARWAYTRSIFAWELWSELDLTGSRDQFPKNFQRPEVVDWHRLMSRMIKDLDPNDHLIGTHVCGDYTHQYPPLIRLPDINFCPVDAYYSSSDPLHIVELLAQTARFNNRYRKPVLVTEFGGTPRGSQGLEHLDLSLHAALWASSCVPVGGTPLFWWWQLVAEENFYGKYAALSRFMQGEDSRDPAAATVVPSLRTAEKWASGLSAFCYRGKRWGRGWIYQTYDFADVDPEGPPTVNGLVMRVPGFADGRYRVEFWDTTSGRRFHTEVAKADNGLLEVAVPPFARDIAFKVRAGG